MGQSPRRLAIKGQAKRSFPTEDEKEDIGSSFPCFLSVCVICFSSVSSAKFVVPKRFPKFPRNRQPHFAQYIGERPELTSHGEKSKKAKNNNKRKIKNEKIKHYIRYNSAGAWLLCVFAGGESEDPPIVGLWHEYYTSDFGPPFETYAQWHGDGLEIETPNFLNGVCMGTWKHIGGRTCQALPRRMDPRWYPARPYERTVRVEASRYGQPSIAIASTAPMIRSFSTRMETSSSRTWARSMQRVFLWIDSQISQTPPQLNNSYESLFGCRENAPERLSAIRQCTAEYLP